MKRKLTAALALPGAAALLLVWGCPAGPPPGTECAAATEACTASDDCCDGLTCTAGVCAQPPPDNAAALPAKTIGFDLIGIHDPDSGDFDANCTASACHPGRTDEVALDGVTPSAHATMVAQFPQEGNDRCIACHSGGPDFVTRSAGGLREQVNMEQVGCALGPCHGPNSPDPLYVGP